MFIILVFPKKYVLSFVKGTDQKDTSILNI